EWKAAEAPRGDSDEAEPVPALVHPEPEPVRDHRGAVLRALRANALRGPDVRVDAGVYGVRAGGLAVIRRDRRAHRQPRAELANRGRADERGDNAHDRALGCLLLLEPLPRVVAADHQSAA